MFNYSLIGGNFVVGFQFGTITNKAVMNSGVQVFVWIFFLLSGIVV